MSLLRGDWGLVGDPVFFDARGVRREEGVLDFGRDLGRLTDGLQDADLIVTTNFYARPVQAAAETLRKPVVILTTDPEFDAAIHRRLDQGQLTVVVADPRFGERWTRSRAWATPRRRGSSAPTLVRENGGVVPIRMGADRFNYPPYSQIIRVTITPKMVVRKDGQ